MWLLLAGPSASGEDAAAALRNQRQGFESAWNKHDAPAMAAYFTLDADLITAFGRQAQGRAQILKTLAFEHTGKGPAVQIQLGLESAAPRQATADVAVTDTDASRVVPEGADAADVRNQMEIRVTSVWKRSGGSWLIFASRMAIKPPTMGAQAGPRPPPNPR